MNARKHTLAALVALLASIALVAPDARGQDAKQDPIKPIAEQQAPTPSPRVTRTTELVGIAVSGTAGEKLGEVADLVVDDEHDCVAFAIVAAGGGKLLPIPFVVLRRIEGTSGRGALRMATPDLTKAPSFDAKSWPEFDRAYLERVYDFYKAQPYWKGARPEHRAREESDADVAFDDPERPAPPTAHAKEHGERPPARTTATTFRTTAVIGQNVKDPRNETVGELFDVVVDEGSGRVAYAILSVGGFLGVDERLLALPWVSLEPPTVDGKPRVLDATAEQIEKAPSFDKKSWPDLADRKIGAELHRYWKQKPYWEGRAQTRAEDLRGSHITDWHR